MDLMQNFTPSFDDANNSLVWCSLPECAAAQVGVLSFTIAVLTLLVNSVACYVILKDRELRQSISGILMVNMCLSGVVPALFNGTLSFCYTTKQLFNHSHICIGTATISNTNVIVALTSIAAMAVDRLVSVSVHLRYHQIATPPRILVFIAFQWLVCLLAMMVPLFEADIIWCVKRYAGCGYQESKYSTLAITLLVYLPSIVAIVISYGRIMWLAFKLRKVHHSDQKFTGLRTTVIILLTFIMYTLPITVYASLVTEDLKRSQTFIIFQDFSTLLLYSGSAICTTTYGGTNKRFKFVLSKIISDSYCFKKNRATLNVRKISPAVITVSSYVENDV